jgi:hypothetical protein
MLAQRGQAARAAALIAALITFLGVAEAKAAPFTPWDSLDSNAWIYYGGSQTRINMYTANAGAYQVGFDQKNTNGSARGENALQFSYGGATTGHMTASQLTGSFGVHDAAGSNGPTYQDLLILVAINAPALPSDFSFSLGTGSNNYQFNDANDFGYYSHPEYVTGRPSGYYAATNPQGENLSYDFAGGMVSVYAAQGVNLAPGQTVTFNYSFADLPGEAVFSVYGYDASVGWIYHTNRSVIDATTPGSPVSTFAVAPEPATVVLLLCGAAWAGRRRCRRGLLWCQ